MMMCPHCSVAVDEHPASDCLNAWVHEAVMGWECDYFWSGTNPVGRWTHPTNGGYVGRPERYSDDLIAAWAALEKTHIHTLRRVVAEEPDTDADWIAIAFLDDSTWGRAKTASLAICRAALKAKIVLPKGAMA